MPRGEKIISEIAKRTEQFNILNYTFLIRNLALEHRPIINFHTALNLIGFFTGIFHGILLVRGIDFISMSLAIVITTLTVSGILIRFAKLRFINQFNRIIHTHIFLTTLLVILIILHVSFS